MMQLTVMGETRWLRDLETNTPTWDAAFGPVTYVGRSLLLWGEHCTDCANPLCYMTCSLYTPRSDLKCRRFENGLQPVIPTRQGQTGRILLRARFRK